MSIAHDGSTPWYSVSSGPVSVHCMSLGIREQLDLEDLWGRGADLTWYQRGPSVLTLDSIGAEADSESSRDRESRIDRLDVEDKLDDDVVGECARGIR